MERRDLLTLGGIAAIAGAFATAIEAQEGARIGGKRVLRIYADADGNSHIQELPIATKAGRIDMAETVPVTGMNYAEYTASSSRRLASDPGAAVFDFAVRRNRSRSVRRQETCHPRRRHRVPRRPARQGSHHAHSDARQQRLHPRGRRLRRHGLVARRSLTRGQDSHTRDGRLRASASRSPIGANAGFPILWSSRWSGSLSSS